MSPQKKESFFNIHTLPLDQTRAPTSLKPSPSPHRLFDMQNVLDKLIFSFHSCHILSPSKTGSVVSAHRLSNTTLLTLIASLYWQRKSQAYILNEDTQPVIRAIRVSHTYCEDEFRQNLRSQSWSIFSYIKYLLSKTEPERLSNATIRRLGHTRRL